MKPPSPLVAALDAESYAYLSTCAPDILVAVEAEIASGKTPEQVQRIAAQHLGPDRQALAVRVWQAARHVAATMRS